MNKVEFVGQIANIKVDNLKINSGYLNGVVFTPDYDGGRYSNFFPTEINQSVTDLDNLVKLIKESQEKVDNWYESSLRAKIVGKIPAGNYQDKDGNTVYQHILEITELELL